MLHAECYAASPDERRRADFRYSRIAAPPGALHALRGADLIVHAGDVGDSAILEALSELAPVVAIRGNVDRGAWAAALPITMIAETGSGLIYVLHDVNELDLDPRAAGFRAVVSGHSHRPSQKVEGGVMYVNPGSAGPRRFDLPVTVARIDLEASAWTVTFFDVLTGAVLEFQDGCAVPGAD